MAYGSEKRENFGSARPENQEQNKKWTFSGRKKSSGGVKALYLAYFFEIYPSRRLPDIKTLLKE